MGEGRVSLGITGQDTVAEHAAAVESMRRERAESGKSTPVEEEAAWGCEEVLDLGFGSCKLQVQVPEKGEYIKPSDLIGKNIGTSFVHLAEEYFGNLERAPQNDQSNGEKPRKLRTKIIELSGSVEAACALGVADGIVDLVGEFTGTWVILILTMLRIGRDNESRRLESNRYSSVEFRRSHTVKESLKPSTRRAHRLENWRCHW